MTIAETVRYFQETARHRSVPVVDADGAMVGMVSRGDALARKINGALSETTLAEHVSDASLPFALPVTPSGEIANLIVDRKSDASGIRVVLRVSLRDRSFI